MSRPPHRSSKPRRVARPILEGLEDRLLLYATTGDLWSYGSRITYSFVPDGTNVAGCSSNLFSSMSSLGYSTAQVETAFEKAFAAWQAATNINLTMVSDNGAAYGTTGNQQDDSRFGDIRIGGETLSPGVLASTFMPPAANGGTLAGDIVMNTNQSWIINSGSGYDLETVAIHEIGHALGMDHSAISSADMYAYYNTQKQSLTSDDTAGIQSIYGTRRQDAFDAASSNNTAATATNINPYFDSGGQISLSGLDITTNTDYDFYSVTAPATTNGTLTVVMQSDNLSSLDPKVIVYNSANVALGTATAPASYGGTVSVTISGVTAGQTFKIKCMAADSGPSGTGSYGLVVNFGNEAINAIAPPNTVVAQQADSGGGAENDQTQLLSIGTLLGTGDNLMVSPSKKFDFHQEHHKPVTIGKVRKLTSHEVTVVSLHPRKTRSI